MNTNQPRRLWSDKELIKTLMLYYTMKATSEEMSASNAKIIDLANKLGRTSASIALRMANYKHLDGVGKGLRNTGSAAARIWNTYSL